MFEGRPDDDDDDDGDDADEVMRTVISISITTTTIISNNSISPSSEFMASTAVLGWNIFDFICLMISAVELSIRYIGRLMDGGREFLWPVSWDVDVHRHAGMS